MVSASTPPTTPGIANRNWPDKSMLVSMTGLSVSCDIASSVLVTYLSTSDQISMSSKSSLRAPHSGQTQLGGTSSHRVPGAMPSSGNPDSSSYIQPQIKHIQVRIFFLLAEIYKFKVRRTLNASIRMGSMLLNLIGLHLMQGKIVQTLTDR